MRVSVVRLTETPFFSASPCGRRQKGCAKFTLSLWGVEGINVVTILRFALANSMRGYNYLGNIRELRKRKRKATPRGHAKRGKAYNFTVPSDNGIGHPKGKGGVEAKTIRKPQVPQSLADLCIALYNILTSQVALGVGCLLPLSPRSLYLGYFHTEV